MRTSEDNINILKRNALNYREKFREALKDDDFFENFIEFFKYLFDEERDIPLDNRCYIIICRKGFSIWLAGILCGLVSEYGCKTKNLISDRKWKKMTVKERHDFVRGRDVFIADDSVITSASAQGIYLSIEGANSRNVAFLTSEHSYDFSKMFQSYADFKTVGTEERKDINEKLLHALYVLAIPFSAESPTYHAIINKTDFEAWKSLANGLSAGVWTYKDTPLDFGLSGTTENTGCFYAPADTEKYGANVLFRGMRVCTRNLLDSVDEIEIFLIPWIIFDVIDYEKADEYLKNQVNECFGVLQEGEEDTIWLRKQLTEGEPERKRRIVHRTISYLYDIGIVKEFQDTFLNGDNLFPFVLPNGVKLESYHFSCKLLKEMEDIQEKILVTGNCPAGALKILRADYEELAEALCEMSYRQLDIPQKRKLISVLEDKLCAQREIVVDEVTGAPIFATDSKKHPLLCYKDKNDDDLERSSVVLNLLRRAIAAFRSDLISYDKNIYLINTFIPGEGSPNVFIKNYDFIYGLYCFMDKIRNPFGKEERFFEEWNKISKNDPVGGKDSLSVVSDIMFNILKKSTYVYWRSYDTIQKTLRRDRTDALRRIDNIIIQIIENIKAENKSEDAMDTFFKDSYN
jgi:hypothetical protein